jgi:hypothetical protein
MRLLDFGGVAQGLDDGDRLAGVAADAARGTPERQRDLNEQNDEIHGTDEGAGLRQPLRA